MNEAMSDVLGPRLSNVLGGTFRRMDIAEREIREAMERHPERAQDIDRNAFALLCPSEVLATVSDEVYRRHVRELLERFADVADTSEPTAAEMCAALSTASLAAPPGPSAAALYAREFIKLFPEKADIVAELAHGVHVEEWLIDEMDRSLRRTLRRNRRS